MRHLLKKALVAVVCFTGVAFTTLTAGAQESCRYDSTVNGGDTNPWPWGKESLFPWLGVQGVWVPSMGGCNSLFVFKAKNVSSENRIIQIVQYDPSSCAKIAWGAGIETDRIVRAAMVTKDGKSFDLTIRSFDENAISSFQALAPSTGVVVLSMYPKGDWERRMSYQMQKVTDVPIMLCDSKIPVFQSKQVQPSASGEAVPETTTLE